MFTLVPLVVALGAASSVSASPSPVKRNVKTNCRSFMADVTASTTTNIDLKSVIGYPANQQQLIQGSINQFKAGSTVMQQIGKAPNITVSGTYPMYFEYCEPKAGGEIKGVFQTHHGLVGNAGYWNVFIDGSPDNSFAESAAAAGWATLSYDRLGVGRSAHPDGTNIVQISYEISQSIAISQALRNGTLGNGVPKFLKVVGVGHSYGSFLLTGLAARAPSAFDQVILTGFSNNVTMGPLGLPGFFSTISNVAYPDRFGGHANDYVITPATSNDQLGFFHYPNYSSSALPQFSAVKGEYTLGQQNTIGSTIALSRAGFSKPVFVITGNNDAPFCASNCSVTSLGGNNTQVNTVRPLYPNVSDSNFGVYVLPDTGHGINFHTTALLAYQQILNFVTSH